MLKNLLYRRKKQRANSVLTFKRIYMKEIKVLVKFFATVILTSLWWMVGIFGPFCTGWEKPMNTNGCPIFIFPLIFTTALIAVTFAYIIKHWDD